MAIYHFSGTVISRSQGRSAVIAAAYRSAEKLYDARQDKTADFTLKKDVAYKEILLPENAPTWMSNREKLWNAVEQNEKRKDAQLAREFNFALPKELSLAQNIELAREFVQKEFVARGMIADLCIHDHKTREGEAQPHAHVMLTMRELTAAGFGQKNRDWNAKENILGWRESWAEHANHYLVLNGIDQTIDHRTLSEQGILLMPQSKIGPAAAKSEMARFAEHQFIARENGFKILADPNIALTAITKQQSTFTHHDLARFVGRHTADAEQFQTVYATVKAAPEIIRLGQDPQNRERYTTFTMLALEKQMLTDAANLDNKRADGHAVPAAQLITPTQLSAEQITALEHIIASGDIKCVVGYAGSGKSTLLNVARQTWEAAGFKVQGATLSGIAAENLEGASGIASRTVASHLYYWDKGTGLTNKDILVIDEAGMIGSRQMARILDEVTDKDAKLVLIGDPQQLQAIEAGAAFRAIAEQVSYVELTKIRRQHEPWQQAATKEFAQGDVEKALARYEQHDHLHEFATQTQAKQNMVEMWNDVRLNKPDKTQIMLAYTRKDAQEINEMARELRRANQELGTDHFIKTERGDRSFAEQDRIYFLKNERSLGVMNGTLGTIEKIDQSQIAVRLDKDLENFTNRTVTVDTQLYNHLDHGYAATIHKAQGVTVDRSYVLASKYMDSHASYVALSRHRDSTNLFWGKDEFSHQKDLAQSLGRDRSKDISLDYGIEKSHSTPMQSPKEPQQHLARLLTGAEIKERYQTAPDPLQAFKESYIANKELSPLEAFRAQYEAQNSTAAQKFQAALQPTFERKAKSIAEEINLLETALEKSNMPQTYTHQLEQCALKATHDKDVMNYFTANNRELAEKITGIANQHEHKRELARDLGEERCL